MNKAGTKINEIIKKFRRQAGLNQKTIGDALGMSRSNYTNKENGKTSFTADELFLTLEVIKKNTSTETYRSCIESLFSNDTPSFISISPIENRSLNEEMHNEDALFVGDSDIEYLAEKRVKSIKRKNPNTVDFTDQETGVEAIHHLIDLEKLDTEAFYTYTGRLKGKVKKITNERVNEDIQKNALPISTHPQKNQRQSQSKSIAEVTGENKQLERIVKQMSRVIDAYEAILKKQGIPLPSDLMSNLDADPWNMKDPEDKTGTT